MARATFAGTLDNQTVQQPRFTNPYSAVAGNFINNAFGSIEKSLQGNRDIGQANYDNEKVNNTNAAILAVNSGQLKDLSSLSGKNVDASAVAKQLQAVQKQQDLQKYRANSLTNTGSVAQQRIDAKNLEAQKTKDFDEAAVGLYQALDTPEKVAEHIAYVKAKGDPYDLALTTKALGLGKDIDSAFGVTTLSPSNTIADSIDKASGITKDSKNVQKENKTILNGLTSPATEVAAIDYVKKNFSKQLPKNRTEEDATRILDDKIADLDLLGGSFVGVLGYSNEDRRQAIKRAIVSKAGNPKSGSKAYRELQKKLKEIDSIKAFNPDNSNDLAEWIGSRK